MTAHWLWLIPALVALAYLAYGIRLHHTQDEAVFWPSRECIGTPADRGLPYEDVALMAGDGTRLHAWYLPRPESRGAVLFLHGNSRNISHEIATLEILHGLGYAVLALDYRGYGRSQGRPSEAGLYRDARAGYWHLRLSRGLDPSAIIVHGRSLGGGPAAWLATREAVAGLVLESTFSSLPEVAQHHYPNLPVPWFLRTRFETARRLPRVCAPVLVIHSRDDEVVPFAHAQMLFAAAPADRRLVEMRGRHCDAHLQSGDTYRAALGAFLAHCTSPP